MNKQAWLLIGCGLLLLLFVFGLATFDSAKKALVSNKLSVATSFYPLYYFTSQIGGDKIRVFNITPAGAEPHDYEPTSSDIAQIEKSKLIIVNGNLEPWGDKLKTDLQGSGEVFLVVGQNIISQNITEKGVTTLDPHIWLDPVLVKIMVTKITDGLISVDPLNKSYYEKNSSSLKAKLDQLDSEFRLGLASCSEKNIITSHSAFGYLAKQYGLDQVSIAGLSPDSEPSGQQLADIITFAKAHQVKYIFFESLVSPKLAETIATEIGAKTLVLNPLEGLSAQAVSQGKNYFTEMEANLTNLKVALACR